MPPPVMQRQPLELSLQNKFLACIFSEVLIRKRVTITYDSGSIRDI
jgi:hypothetical protein